MSEAAGRIPSLEVEEEEEGASPLLPFAPRRLARGPFAKSEVLPSVVENFSGDWGVLRARAFSLRKGMYKKWGAGWGVGEEVGKRELQLQYPIHC